MPLLGEHVTRGQWLAVICGFVGVLVIIHPGGELFTPAVLLPLCSALFFCFYQLLTRILSQYDTPTTSNFFAGPVQYPGDERDGAVLLADPHPVAWGDDAGAGHLRDDRALAADPGVSALRRRPCWRRSAIARLCSRGRWVGWCSRHTPDYDHGGRYRGDLHERVGRCLAAAASVNQALTVGILRGAMKYIHVSAMKYIAGIRVNNTV